VAIDARAADRRPSGVGIYTRTLISSLAAHDGDNSYLLVSNRPVFLSNALPSNMQVIEEAHSVGNLWLQIQCPRLLRRLGADIFHGPNFLAPLFAPCPTVLTIHDLSSFLFPKLHTVRNNLVQRLLPAAIRRAARVVAISENTKRDLIQHLHVPEEKIRVAPNALPPGVSRVEDKRVLDDTRRRYELPDRFFLFVGTLEPRKNIPRLLDAFALFARRDEGQTHLVLVGEHGWGAQEVLAHHRRLQLGDRVRFLGYVDHGELPSLYSLARALIMPSVYEGFGLPVLEAMACGAPVLAAENSGLAETAGDAALTCHHDDVERMAELMSVLDRDEELRARLAEKGRERAKQFAPRTFVEAMQQVYRETLESRS
jgi:glycosyltransferase involved in cell wall biosynthesis